MSATWRTLVKFGKLMLSRVAYEGRCTCAKHVNVKLIICRPPKINNCVFIAPVRVHFKLYRCSIDFVCCFVWRSAVHLNFLSKFQSLTNVTIAYFVAKFLAQPEPVSCKRLEFTSRVVYQVITMWASFTNDYYNDEAYSKRISALLYV